MCSDELNHASIIDGVPRRPGRRGRLSPQRPRRAGASCWRRTADRLAAGGHATRCSRWTATSPPSTRWPSCAPSHGALLVLDEAHSVLGPPHRPRAPCVVGTLSKTLGSMGGFVAADQALVDLCRNTARVVHLHHRLDPGRQRGRARRARRAALGGGRRACERVSATNIDRVRAGSPLPDHPGGAGLRGARRRRHRGAARPRPARPGDPSAHRRAGHVSAAHRDLGRAHERRSRASRGVPRAGSTSTGART